MNKLLKYLSIFIVILITIYASLWYGARYYINQNFQNIFINNKLALDVNSQKIHITFDDIKYTGFPFKFNINFKNLVIDSKHENYKFNDDLALGYNFLLQHFILQAPNNLKYLNKSYKKPVDISTDLETIINYPLSPTFFKSIINLKDPVELINNIGQVTFTANNINIKAENKNLYQSNLNVTNNTSFKKYIYNIDDLLKTDKNIDYSYRANCQKYDDNLIKYIGFRSLYIILPSEGTTNITTNLKLQPIMVADKIIYNLNANFSKLLKITNFYKIDFSNIILSLNSQKKLFNVNFNSHFKFEENFQHHFLDKQFNVINLYLQNFKHDLNEISSYLKFLTPNLPAYGDIHLATNCSGKMLDQAIILDIKSFDFKNKLFALKSTSNNKFGVKDNWYSKGFLAINNYPEFTTNIFSYIKELANHNYFTNFIDDKYIDLLNHPKIAKKSNKFLYKIANEKSDQHNNIKINFDLGATQKNPQIGVYDLDKVVSLYTAIVINQLFKDLLKDTIQAPVKMPQNIVKDITGFTGNIVKKMNKLSKPKKNKPINENIILQQPKGSAEKILKLFK